MLNANGTPWANSFTATRAWIAIEDVALLANLTVTVVPMSANLTRLSRSTHKFGGTQYILVQQQAGEADKTACDTLATVAQAIRDYFANVGGDGILPITGLTGYAVEKADFWQGQLFDVGLLWTGSLWETVIEITVTQGR